MTTFPFDLGKVSAKYESGGKGVDFVSKGRKWGDPGGDSYGVHQLSGAYSMAAFLRSEWGKPWAEKFQGKGMRPNTDAFNKRYKIVAKADPEDFAYAQKAFYATTHYLPVKEHARKKGFTVTDRGVQEALFSMSVQHGGAKKIVDAAAVGGTPISAEAQIRRLFKERLDYINDLRSLTRKIKKALGNRYRSEVEECVDLVGSSIIKADPLPDLVEYSPLDSITNVLEEFYNTSTEIATDVAKAIVKVLDDNKKKEPPSPTSSLGKRGNIPWLETARALQGLREIPGAKHSKEIMSWAGEGVPKWITEFYSSDEIPWCGLFIAHLMVENGIKVTIKNPLSAKAWNEFGFECSPQLGAIMIFTRKGGGHVGLYVGEDQDYYHILGGNQKNSVNVTKVARSRFMGARWPRGYATLQEQYAGRIVREFSKGEISTNEA